MRIMCPATLLTMLLIALPPTDCGAEDHTFELSLLDGSEITSTIASIDQDGNLNGPITDRPLSLQDVVTIERSETKSTTDAHGAVEVQLVGGGTLFFQSLNVDDNGLKDRSDTPLIENLPLEAVEAIVFRPSQTGSRAIAQRTGDKDTVVVQTSDGMKLVEGFFEGIANDKVGFRFKGKSREIGLEKVSAIILADMKPSPPTGTSTTIKLFDGSTIGGVITSWSEHRISVSLSPHAKITLPVDSIKRIEVATENLMYLSNLLPKSVEQKTIFAHQRTWQSDASIEGNPLSLTYQSPSGERNVKQFAKGLSMQSWSRIEFANENHFNRFQATVGIDAETNGRGDCVVKIVSDGIPLWRQRITAKSDPVEVDVDISGTDVIALIVDPGEQFDLADHVDWANARFVKTN